MSQVGVPQICGTPDGLMAQVVTRMQAVQACILFAWKTAFNRDVRKEDPQRSQRAQS
jgi:hypothetical protein